MTKKIKVPEVWDDCKTKEQKQAFMDELEHIEATGKFRSFDDYIFDCHMKELSR